ncbi:MAG: hypothetical protein ACM3X3_06910 [Betaproteobacteria bacterium]
MDEHAGLIASWEDYERYPWPRPEDVYHSWQEFVAKNLPAGMKIMVCPSSGVLEVVAEHLLGFEGLSLMLYENEELVEAVFNRVGELICGFYENIVTMDNVAGFFQGAERGRTQRSPFGWGNASQTPWLLSATHMAAPMFTRTCLSRARDLDVRAAATFSLLPGSRVETLLADSCLPHPAPLTHWS